MIVLIHWDGGIEIFRGERCWVDVYYETAYVGFLTPIVRNFRFPFSIFMGYVVLYGGSMYFVSWVL